MKHFLPTRYLQFTKNYWSKEKLYIHTISNYQNNHHKSRPQSDNLATMQNGKIATNQKLEQSTHPPWLQISHHPIHRYKGNHQPLHHPRHDWIRHYWVRQHLKSETQNTLFPQLNSSTPRDHSLSTLPKSISCQFLYRGCHYRFKKN